MSFGQEEGLQIGSTVVTDYLILLWQQELEDMLLQMEKHFKSEQKARQTVEAHLEQTMQAELNVKKELDSTLQKHSEEAQELENERESTRMVCLHIKHKL